MKINKIIPILVFLVSCSNSKEVEPKKDFKANMRDAQKVSAELFSYVWNKNTFLEKKNEHRIKDLLVELGKDFHEIKKEGGSLELEPGFHVILDTQRDLVKDISNRFENGQKDYALWRLKGMSQNCIACHSRLNVPIDFFGEVDVKGVEGKFSEAEFLFASRKFDLASEKFIKFIKNKKNNPDLSYQALKYWVLIEIRVKGRFSELQPTIKQVLSSKIFNEEKNEIINKWLIELPLAQKVRVDNLLGTPRKLETIKTSEEEFISTVVETSLLHSYLDSNPLTNKRKNALLNLGASYLNLALPSLSVFGPLYLEQTIKEFPKTKEAKEAFKLYNAYVELENTGSSGTHLDREASLKLQNLKKLSGL